MKKFLHALCMVCFTLIGVGAGAQCSNVTLNWDYLDYLSYNGNYVNNGYLASNTVAQTQYFSFGTQRIKIVHNYTAANSPGENTTNTAETGAYGTGADVQYIGDGAVTYTFDNAVSNVKFSVFDIDKSQKVQVTAVNGIVPKIITMARLTNVVLTIAGSGTTVASATANNTTVANANVDGTINVDITGPITSFTITVTATGTCASSCGVGGVEDGSYWVSDITACSTGTLPANYYNPSKPFTGQGGYILHAIDSAVYMLNPATGVTKFLFKDATGLGRINSMGYDPINHWLYYVYSLTAAGNSKKLMKYDFSTNTISTVLADITTIGIPATNTSGAESGAASFYNGCLYLGIETSNSGRTSGREATVWRIEFDVSNVPYRACQVFAVPVDNGSGTLTHDWSDFVIDNGVLYDYDGAGVTTQTDVYQYNLITGAVTNFALPSGWTPGQIAVDWNHNLYQLYATTVAPTVNPYVALYNPVTGTIGTQVAIVSSPMYTPAIPSIGDAAEAFKPRADFGDAPATYDPAISDPAVHEVDNTLYLGSTYDIEWATRGQTALANSDNYDDGLAYITTFNPSSNQYLTQVTVFNNTGANATICAWLDYNGNGVFNTGEGISVTVPTSASPQSVYLFWPAISSSLVNGSYTYLRIRVTSSTNGMTTANPTGYFSNGEVEDYRVPVNSFPLSTALISFDAKKIDGRKVQLEWQTANETSATVYEVQKSNNSQKWDPIQKQTAANSPVLNNYSFIDLKPYDINFYRLKTTEADGSFKYSEVKKINYSEAAVIRIFPNPASDHIIVSLENNAAASAHASMFDVMGRIVLEKDFDLKNGSNSLNIPLNKNLPGGIYSLTVLTDEKTYTQKIMIKKQ